MTTPEYADEHVRLGVEAPTASRPTLNLTAVGLGMTSTVELSMAAAAGLASLLLRAAADGIARTDPEETQL